MSNATTRTFSLIALGLHLVLVLVRPISDPDIWWHLRTGGYILQTRSIPRSDIYSFTAFGKPWIAHEWLSEVAMYGVYHFLSWVGLIVIFALISAAVFFYVGYHCKAPLYLIILAILISHAAALVVLRDPRPRLLTLGFSAAFFVIIREFVRTGKSTALWILPALMIIWVNAHAGYPLGFVFILLAFVVLMSGKNRGNVRQLVVVLALCVGAVLLNPHGVRMLWYPFETQFSAIQMAVISEWNAPNFKQLNTLPFLFLILVVLATLGLSRKRISGFDLLCLVMALFMSLRSYRHVSVLSLVAIPVLAEHSWDLISSEERVQRILEKSVPLILLAVVGIIHLPALYQTIRHPIDLSEDPVSATAFLEQTRLPDNIFSKYDWNDYLIWNAPSRKVFIDGRADMYGDEFLAEYVRLYTEGNNWEAIFEQFGVRTIMIDVSSPLASEIRNKGDWTEVYRDNQAIIFTKR